MQSRRDSSVLRSLAISFGEGLAFSVGTKLVQSATRPANQLEPPDFAPTAARLEQIEQRLVKVERPRDPHQLDQTVIHAIVTALETRLQEQSARTDRRIEEHASALREEVKEMHREFAATVANVVGEQVAQRVTEVEERLQDRVIAAVAPLQAEVAELRERLAETENTMAEFVSAISMMCRKAAERNEQRGVAEGEPQADPEPLPAVAAAAPVEPVLEMPLPEIAATRDPLPAIAASTSEPVLDLPIPAFAQARRPSGVLRIPVASSFLVACMAVGLLLRLL